VWFVEDAEGHKKTVDGMGEKIQVFEDKQHTQVQKQAGA
jgi:hypothetical protein